jgi:hypothetical protein
MVKLSLCLVSKKESHGVRLGLQGDQIIEPCFQLSGQKIWHVRILEHLHRVAAKCHLVEKFSVSVLKMSQVLPHELTAL